MNQSYFVRLSIFLANLTPVAIRVTLERGIDFVRWNRGNEIRGRNQATK
jgi:hypothetical protein